MDEWLLCVNFRLLTWNWKAAKLLKLADISMGATWLLEENITKEAKVWQRVFKIGVENSVYSKHLLPKLWTKYVDDIFTIVHKGKVMEMLNKVHRTLRFATDIGEKEIHLAFLGNPPIYNQSAHKPRATQIHTKFHNDAQIIISARQCRKIYEGKGIHHRHQR